VLLLQILWWRVRRPAADVRVLALLLVLVLGAFAALAVFPASSAALAMPQGWPAVLYSLALAGAVSLLYLITYAGLDAKSPSTLIVMAAGRSMEGLTMEDAASLFTDEEFIVQRVDGLVRIGQLRRSGENLHLTMHGRIFLESFLLPRRIMGLQHWGG
jgi:hypothetical protein